MAQASALGAELGTGVSLCLTSVFHCISLYPPHPSSLVATHQGRVATNLFSSSFCQVAPCLHSYAEKVATVIQSLWPVRITFVYKIFYPNQGYDLFSEDAQQSFVMICRLVSVG